MTKRIASLFALTTFVLAVGGSAFAADIAVKAPLPAPAPVYSWTGWYAGVNAGASFGRAKTDFGANPVTVTGLLFGTPVPGLAGINVPEIQNPSGFIGGGQIGYNWQYSPLIVVGLEADFQGALERDHDTLTNSFSLTGIPTTILGTTTATGTTVVDYSTKIDWFGTVRARIGYVWGNGEVLSCVTGGLAYGEVKINGASAIGGTAGGVGFSVANAFSESRTNTGWVVGYGTEGHLPGNWLPGNWTWKIEGLYVDLGTLDSTGVITGTSNATSPVGTTTGGQVSTHTHFTDGILRAGLNYRFY
jgi:outer membrane immunogenic protein